LNSLCSSIFVKWANKLCPLFIFVIFAFSGYPVKAQVDTLTTTCRISGTVKSGSDSVVVPYATIYLSGKFTGTVANSDGQFELKVNTRNDATIEIFLSALGYKAKTVTCGNTNTELGDIFLEETTYELSEVVIESNRFDSASYIFDNAIKFIRFNYPTKPHLMEGFFRELSMKDTMYTRLIEAAVIVQETGYQKEYLKGESLEETKSRLKVIELRKSDDFREYDLLSKAFTLLLGERNELYMILRNNYVRLFGTKYKDHLLSLDNIKRFEPEYLGRSEWAGQPIYIVSLTIPQAFRNEVLKFFIVQSDFAIIKIEHIGLPGVTWRGESSSLIEGKYFDKREITYRKVANRYYPIFIHTIWSAYGASSTVQSDGKTLKQYTDALFLLTNVYEDDYSRIKWKNAEKQDRDLYKNNTPYNEKFWENYNTVKLNPLKREVVDLEKEKTLKEQYKGSQN
jgi:hypothetical protein